MKIIQGKKSRDKYYYDSENMTISDKVGNTIKLFEILDGLSDNNLSILADELFHDIYNSSNCFKERCKYIKDNNLGELIRLK